MTRFTAEETQVIVHVTLPLFLSESAIFPELGSEGRGRVWGTGQSSGDGRVPGGVLLPGFRLVKAGVIAGLVWGFACWCFLSVFITAFPVSGINGLGEYLEVGEVIGFPYSGDLTLDLGQWK